MPNAETHVTHTGPTNPVTASPASFEAWQALVAPGDVFRHPREVLAHPTLTAAEKRAILASWASDAHAMEGAPALRCLSGCKAEPVSVEAVLAALTTLDGNQDPGRGQLPARSAPKMRRRDPLASLHRYIRRKRRDDDDDPPPCPAVIMPRPWSPMPTVEAVAA
jgi:hypothetical protein